MPASTRRRTRRDRRVRRDGSAAVSRLPWRTVRNPHPPTRTLSEDQVEAIHHASLRVLRDIGMKVLSPKARALYAGAGANADEDTALVRFDVNHAAGWLEGGLTASYEKLVIDAAQGGGGRRCAPRLTRPAPRPPRRSRATR